MPPRSRSSRFAGGGLITSKTLKEHEAGSRPRPAHGDHKKRHQHAHDLVDDDRSRIRAAKVALGYARAPDADREDQDNRDAMRHRGLWQHGPQQKAGGRTKCTRRKRDVAETETGGECECGGNQRHTSIPTLRAGTYGRGIILDWLVFRSRLSISGSSFRSFLRWRGNLQCPLRYALLVSRHGRRQS